METVTALGVLWLVLLLQIKHSLCDGPFQTLWMIGEKGTYGKAGGVLHALIHGSGSLVALKLFGLPWLFAAGLALVDFASHYHIDYFKELLVRRRGWTSRDRYFWWTLAADQTSHHITYIAMSAATVLWSD